MKILKFGAIWCSECIVMKSIWDEIEEEIFDFDTESFDADEHYDDFKKYDIEKIPVYIFMDDNGSEVARLEGPQNKEDIVELLDEHINK